MKTKIIILAFISVLLSFQTKSQTQIINQNFENWTNNNNAVNWKTFNFFNLFFTAAKTTDKFEGNFAAKLTTQNVFGTIVPGVITLGDLDLTTFRPIGGQSYTDRPSGLSFQMKYAPVAGDSMFFFAYLTKWNEITHKSDTIGGTAYFTEYNYQDYTNISLPFIYFSTETPDTINIGFLSSAFSPKTGSVLIVDDLQITNDLVFPTTLCLPATNISSTGFTANWLPIPGATNYLLDISENLNFTSFLPGFEQFEVGTDNSYILNSIEPGIYYYRITVVYLTTQSILSNKTIVALPVETIPASNITSTGFKANWTQALSADSYRLDIATDIDFTQFVAGFENKQITQGNSAQITGLNNETSYFYRVRVEYGTVTSENSNVIETSTDISKITNLKETDPFKIFNFKNNIQINFEDINSSFDIKISDLQGKTLFLKQNISHSIEIKLKQGIYILKINNKQHNYIKKIIIK